MKKQFQIIVLLIMVLSATAQTPCDTINFNITQNDTTICSGDSIVLSVSGATQSVNFQQACTLNELPINLQNGLVGYWPFCGNANDESGNGNNGTVNGATLTTDSFGNANTAYSFNGLTDYIALDNVFFGGSPSVSALTYHVKFKVNQLPGIGQEYAISGQQSYWRHKMILINEFGNIYFHGTSSGTYIDVISPANSIQPNQWYSIAVTFSNSTFVSSLSSSAYSSRL
jgi:hypothetical protein